MKLDILLVDDEPIIHESIGRYLIKCGHRVTSAYDGNEGLERVRERVPQLALIDIRMPRRDGLSFLEAVRAVAPNLACVIITAHADLDDAITALRRGAIDFLRKPVELVELDAVLERVTRMLALQQENRQLKGIIRSIQREESTVGGGRFIGESPQVLEMLDRARKVAATDTAVLITGETGTGKELLAQAIHDASPRRHKVMVKVNCAALPASLIEGEIFGREKGAYTGALTRQAGRFEAAEGGTIFLDEIGDLPLDLQSKLLRVLQDGQYERLGSHRPLKTDARVIAATNHDLEAMIRERTFREDLFHRLHVFPIEMPPLRERPTDIPLLVWTFVQEFNTHMGKTIDSIPNPSMERLMRYAWPGNVRELRNLIERAMIVSEGRVLRVEFPRQSEASADGSTKLEDVERMHILEVLRRTNWRIRGGGGAAEVLGMPSSTLRSRMKKLGIVRPLA